MSSRLLSARVSYESKSSSLRSRLNWREKWLGRQRIAKWVIAYTQRGSSSKSSRLLTALRQRMTFIKKWRGLCVLSSLKRINLAWTGWGKRWQPSLNNQLQSRKASMRPCLQENVSQSRRQTWSWLKWRSQWKHWESKWRRRENRRKPCRNSTMSSI